MIENKIRPGGRGVLCGFQPGATPFGFDAARSGMAQLVGRLAAFSHYKDLHPSLFLHLSFNFPLPQLCARSSFQASAAPLSANPSPIAQPSHLA